MATRLLDRRYLATAAFLIAPALLAQEAIAPKKPLQLFNGKNLDGWYTWLRESKYEDPKKVFSVVNGAIRISGEEWGGVTTKATYRDYHLIVEWRWGGATLGDRKEKARDSGILVHGVGEDGGYSGIWLESIESQIIEGGAGDFIMVGGKTAKPSLTVEARKDAKGETYWHAGAAPITRNSGRFNWFNRDPAWRDVVNFRGANDVEKPVGEWNRQEVICDGSGITNIVNGIVVNKGTNSSHTSGKIQIQSEGAEILIRKVELRPVRAAGRP